MGDETKYEVGKDLVTLAQASRQLAASRIAEQDWSGIPLPVVGLTLVVEPRYKLKAITEFRWKQCFDENGVRIPIEEEPPPPPSDCTAVNSWWSDRLQLNIHIVKNPEGRAELRLSFSDRLAFAIRTLDASEVWPVEAEQKAQKKLASLIPDHVFGTYFLTGQFAEESKRSKLTYLFRRGRPTIVLRQNEEGSVPLCALCLHPIGYYADTWAGVMCPTDEVIAHLLMMRGSEEKFWANANQHPVDHPAAGV